MHSKIKARDVVAGWPRSKHTTAGRPVQPLWLLISRWYSVNPLSDVDKIMEDYRGDADYHCGQQRMLDRHRSEYRRPTAAWLARKIIGSGSGLVITTCGETPDTLILGEPEKPWVFAPAKESPIAGFKQAPFDPKIDDVLYTNLVVDFSEQRGEMKRP